MKTLNRLLKNENDLEKTTPEDLMKDMDPTAPVSEPVPKSLDDIEKELQKTLEAEKALEDYSKKYDIEDISAKKPA